MRPAGYRKVATRDASLCAATLLRMLEYVEKAGRWGGARFGRRIAKSIPFVGAVVVLATVAGTMRRKGAVGGLADSGLNAIPYLGALKNVVEVVRGEDFFPDRTPPRRRASTTGARRG